MLFFVCFVFGVELGQKRLLSKLDRVKSASPNNDEESQFTNSQFSYQAALRYTQITHVILAVINPRDWARKENSVQCEQHVDVRYLYACADMHNTLINSL